MNAAAEVLEIPQPQSSVTRESILDADDLDPGAGIECGFSIRCVD
jgi:hypothetical protein